MLALALGGEPRRRTPSSRPANVSSFGSTLARIGSSPRSQEVATPPPTGAVSVESAQHLTGRETPHAVVVFVGDRLAQGAGPLLVAREPIAPQGGLRPRRDLGRERDCGVERGARWDQPVRESHAKRFVPGYPTAGQDEVERVAVSDQPSEPNRAAVHQWNAP